MGGLATSVVISASECDSERSELILVSFFALLIIQESLVRFAYVNVTYELTVYQ